MQVIRPVYRIPQVEAMVMLELMVEGFSGVLFLFGMTLIVDALRRARSQR